MISFLRVTNLAIVEEFAIEPGDGLNVLTGETGAGKSLLIDSLELLSGARGTAESVRTGTDKLTVEAVFHVNQKEAASLLSEATSSEAESGEVIVRREISENGRGRVVINGAHEPVRSLVTLMDGLLEIHGQQQVHDRVAGHSARQLVDAYAGHHELLAVTQAAHSEWRDANRELQSLQDAHRDRTLRLDLLRYQISEIGSARPVSEEEESLRSEKLRLSHAREILEVTSGAYSLLEEDEFSALSQIARASQSLGPLSRSIDEVQKLTAELEDIRYRLKDVAESISELGQNVRDDPSRLDEIEERLVIIDRLKKKYGGSIEAVLEHLSTVTAEFDRLSDYESSMARLEERENATSGRYRLAASRLSSSRKEAAARLEKVIQSELADLAMERTTLHIELTVDDEKIDGNSSSATHGRDGIDRVEILIAPNRGEELKPMRRIASGGELSRIQLAIAAALFKASDRRAAATLVFDEIDSGVSGRVAEAVGEKLRELGRNNQVICVTHLPQIASLGATHFHVWKEEVSGRTVARIRKLDSSERVAEIARMLGGESVSASATVHARELLLRGSSQF